MKIFPKETDFFTIFEKAAANVTHAATLFVGIMEYFSNLEHWAKEVHELEQEGDVYTHDIIRKLNKTFVTPIDREDIHALASRLDDILDLLWNAADRLTVFKLQESTKHAIIMSKDLLSTVELVEKAIKRLKEKNYAHIQEFCIEINKLENKIDRGFGTNTLHGTLLYAFHNGSLNANTWAANRAGSPRPPDTQKWMGGTLGGPILKDRTFFFASYQRYQDNQAAQVTNVRMPTPAMMNGDFSAIPGFFIRAVNPQTGLPIGNVIPSYLINPVAAQLKSRFPTIEAYNNALRYFWGFEREVYNNELLFKVDHKLGEAHQLSGSYMTTKALGQLRSRLGELPRDREINVICRSGQRAYMATRILLQNGFKAKNVSGGMLSLAQNHMLDFTNEI